jgi:hypothetical protein
VNVSSTITSGRIVKTTGDGILIEFPSVVEAVAYAIEVQRGMAARDDATAEDQRIKFRVGINSRNGFAWTHRWREMDSNHGFLTIRCEPCRGKGQPASLPELSVYPDNAEANWKVNRTGGWP